MHMFNEIKSVPHKVHLYKLKNTYMNAMNFSVYAYPLLVDLNKWSLFASFRCI